MLHLIAYDVASGRRLRRVATVCEDFGVRIEKSVFECELESADFERFWKRIESVIDSERDSVVDYPIGMMDRKRIKTLGVVNRQDEKILIF